MAVNRLNDQLFGSGDPQRESQFKLAAIELGQIPSDARQLIISYVEAQVSALVRRVKQHDSLDEGLFNAGSIVAGARKLEQDGITLVRKVFEEHAVPFKESYAELSIELFIRGTVEYAQQFIDSEDNVVQTCVLRLFAESRIQDPKLEEIGFNILQTELTWEEDDMRPALALEILSSQNPKKFSDERIDFIAGFLDNSYSIPVRVSAASALGGAERRARRAAAAITDLLGDLLLLELRDESTFVTQKLLRVVPELRSPSDLAWKADEIFNLIGVPLNPGARERLTRYLRQVSDEN